MQKFHVKGRAPQIGDVIPSVTYPITNTAIVAWALATRDYQPVHHDIDCAKRLGHDRLFSSTHATTGQIERFLLEWGGEDIFIRKIKLRLGNPNYSDDEMVLSGVLSSISEDGKIGAIHFVGRNSLGNHVEGTATIEFIQGNAK